MDFDPRTYLETFGSMPDAEIDVAPAALAFSGMSRHGLSLDRYFNHLKELAVSVRECYAQILEAGGAGNARDKLAAIKKVIIEEYGYQGDEDHYDDLQNADMAAVIERRKGLPIALAILCIHAGRAQGWSVQGINFPGHFICRLDEDGERLLFDPFFGCKILEAPDLRAQLKRVMGQGAELSSDYMQEAQNREILFRLQNNIKLRLIDAEDYAAALEIVLQMRLVDPSDYRLALDEGVLCAKINRHKSAIKALEYYIQHVPSYQDRAEAELLLSQIKAMMN